MSPFPGHVSLSAYCIVIGIWWLLNATRRRATAKRYYLPYRSSSWYLCQRFPNTPLEPLLFFVAFFINTVYDIYAAFVHPNGFRWHVIQHIPIYLMAVMTSVVQMLQFRSRGTFPRGFDYLFQMATQFINIIIIYNHLYGRAPLDVICHMQLVYASIILGAAIFLEMRNNDHPLFANLRGMFMMTIGMIIGRTGFLLYTPEDEEQRLDQQSHRSIAIANFLFGSELLLSFLTALLFNFLFVRFFCCDNLYKQVMRQQELHVEDERVRLTGGSRHDPDYLPPEYYQSLKSGNSTALISNGKSIA